MYSFSLFSSPITFPFCFAVHTWVVLESPELGVKRYEIHKFFNKKTGNYLYVNAQAPNEGMPIFMIPKKFYSKSKFKSRCIFKLTGLQAKSIIENIESNISKYPYLNKYSLYPGPNSNTFTRWVLDLNITTKDLNLPFNAFGRFFNRSLDIEVL